MDGRIPDCCTSGSCGARGVGGDHAHCLRDSLFRPLVFSDHHSEPRTLVPLPAREAPRQLQVMVDLLAPFAGNTAPELAELLRQEFGSLSSTFRAPDWQLRSALRDYPTEANLLISARRLILAANREHIRGTIVDPYDRSLLEYLKRRLCGGLGERLLVIYCDHKQRYILDEDVGRARNGSIRFDMGHLFQRALTVGAKSLVLAHNHPSGHCIPSDQDLTATTRLVRVAGESGLRIVDHIIVTREQAYSMRGQCLL